MLFNFQSEAIVVQYLKYEMKFGMEIDRVEKLYEIYVYVAKHRVRELNTLLSK